MPTTSSGPLRTTRNLRRHGLKIAERGGKNAKKRAVVAVARKLSVLLHRLWITGELYEPLYNAHTDLEARQSLGPMTISSGYHREEVMFLAR